VVTINRYGDMGIAQSDLISAWEFLKSLSDLRWAAVTLMPGPSHCGFEGNLPHHLHGGKLDQEHLRGQCTAVQRFGMVCLEFRLNDYMELYSYSRILQVSPGLTKFNL
jgi:hypothetical protein